MITVSRITIREILLPLVEPFRTATGRTESRRIILLEIDGDFETTWSECVAGAVPEYTMETVDSAWNVLVKSIIPRVTGRQFEHPSAVHAFLAAEAVSHPMACAAIEMGSWAIAAGIEGKSLALLLAESCAAASTPRESVAAGVVIGLTSDADEVADRARKALAAGYRRIKLKVSPDSDVGSIRRLKEIAGDRVAIDANGTFSLENPGHLQMLRELDALGMSMIEQPFAADAIAQHGELQRILKTPICLDESISSLASVDAMLSLQSARIVNLKPGRVGGFTESIAIHDRCSRAGIPVWCGGMLESGIGRAYNVALASLPNFTLPADLSPSARYWQRDVVTPPWTMSPDGFIDVPLDQAGAGVSVDVAFIDEVTVRQAGIMA